MSFPPLGRVLIALRSLQLHPSAVGCVAGFFAAWCFGRLRAAKHSRSTWTQADFSALFFYCVVGVLVGSRVGFVLLYGLEYWRHDWLYPLKIWDGGASFHGGLLGLIVACESVALKQCRNTGEVLDFASPLVGFGILFGYIGNIMAVEYWGPAGHPTWDVIYQVHVHDLSAALLEGLVLGSVTWGFSLGPRPRLAPFGLFLAGYGVTAFFVEFFRGPDGYRGYRLFNWLTQSQLLSAMITMVGLILLIRAYLIMDAQRQSPDADRFHRQQ